MYIANIPLSQNSAIKLTDSIQFALDYMEDFQFQTIAVVDEDDYLGYLTLQDLSNVLDNQFSIATLHLRTDPIYVRVDQHPYDAMRAMTAFDKNILPVLDANNKYQGGLTSIELIKAITELQTLNDIGALIVLHVGIHDFSLSKIAHIVESEDCNILNCVTKALPESSVIEVTLKINKANIANLISSFARQNFNVVATFNTFQEFDDLEDRYQQLMNYINI